MTFPEQILYLLIFSALGLYFLPILPMIIKNYKKSTPSPNNKLAIFDFLLINLITLGILYHSYLLNNDKLFILHIATYSFAIILPLLIPKNAIELIKYGRLRMSSRFLLTVKFKPEHKLLKFLWRGRILFAIPVILIYLLMNI